jgi:anti-anti-sigma factor
MKFTVDKADAYCILKVLGDKLNTLNAPDIKSEILLLFNQGYRNLILNLEMVQYADSSGLSVMLMANRMAAEKNGVVIICGLNDHVHKMVSIAHLDKVLEIVPTLQEAVDAVGLHLLEQEVLGEHADDDLNEDDLGDAADSDIRRLGPDLGNLAR